MIPAYVLENVAYAYAARHALMIDKLTVAAGRVTALIGPNGSGKSTLLSLLAFLRQPTGGEIYFFGRRTCGEDLPALRRRVGLVAQNPYLLRGTVLDNVSLGLKLRGASPSERRAKSLSALARIGLAGFADRPARELSGGEAQKVALARALVLEPEVLLFDEPFTYLDQGSTATMEAILSHYASEERRTVVFSSHDQLHGLALADAVVSLFEGRPLRAPLINLMHGRLEAGWLDTGRLRIRVPLDMTRGAHLAIDPREIVLSLIPLNSSIRNSFEGRVVMIAEEGARVRVTVDAGEKFHALITPESMEALSLALGKTVWVNFKANSVTVF
jgi:tungstate transport system ATP-binding protein